MDNRSARIEALRKYISLLRQEESRLDWVSARASATDRAQAGAAMEANSKKLHNADKELRELEGRSNRPGRPRGQGPADS